MTNPLDDYSRLHATLPNRYSERDIRHARRTTNIFFKNIKDNDFGWTTLPCDNQEIAEVRFYLSYLIDQATLQVYNEAIVQIQGTQEHRANFTVLRDAPKNCGGFKKSKAILSHANSFEQMVALDHVIAIQRENWPTGRRTYSFDYDDDHVIPLYVASRTNCRASTMTTTLGAAKSQYKVPTYEQFSSSAEMARSSIFVKPLEGLEVVRQPYFSGATILKANAFEAGTIDHAHRYGVQASNGEQSPYGCVEYKLQNNSQQAFVKERSAGANILFMEQTASHKPLAKTLLYEAWCSEGYRDDANTFMKVNDYWNALRKAAESGREMDELVNLTRKLFVSRTGPFTSPVVNNFYAEKLFQRTEQ